MAKLFFTEKFGMLDFKSNALYSKYETNKQKTFLTNDVIWRPSSFITKKGFVNTLEGMVRNTNYETRKTKEYKDGDTVNEINGVLAYKTSLPMKKDSINNTKLFSPNFVFDSSWTYEKPKWKRCQTKLHKFILLKQNF
jgi:hypothetical protein